MANVRLLELRNTYKWGGGPDKTILLSAERHDRSRVEVVVAYVRDVHDHEFSIGAKARAKGLTFYEVEERGKIDLNVLRALKEVIIRHDINIIHSHDYKTDLFAYLLRWQLRRPVRLLSTAHAWVIIGMRGEIYRYLDLRLMRRFDHLIAVSHATKEEMIKAGVPSKLISVIHNGIDTETWTPARASRSFRAELNLGQSFPVIGYVGRLMPEKDLKTWLRAAALVAQKHPQAKFVLVGEGKDHTYLEEIERVAVDLGIADRTYFSGYRSDLLPVYAAFDLFLLSSRREGLPNSILEAMAMGVPTVTTDVAGAKELVLDGATGYVLPQGDAQGIAGALNALTENEALRQKMGQASRNRIEREFSFDNRLPRVEALYERVLELPRTAGSPLAALDVSS